MKEIAKTDFYELHFDEAKNRMYLKIIGFWKSDEQVPNYISDVDKVISMTKPGFTRLSDAIEMKAPATSVLALHEKAEKHLLAAGLDRTAVVMPEVVLLDLQLKKFADKTDMKKKEFATLEEAEAWLDSGE